MLRVSTGIEFIRSPCPVSSLNKGLLRVITRYCWVLFPSGRLWSEREISFGMMTGESWLTVQIRDHIECGVVARRSPTNQKNWPNVFLYMTLYWTNVLSIVPTLGRCLWFVGKLSGKSPTSAFTYTCLSLCSACVCGS